MITFGMIEGMKLCPPNPGSTDITKTKSINWRYGRTSETAVFGLIAMPTRIPLVLIS